MAEPDSNQCVECGGPVRDGQCEECALPVPAAVMLLRRRLLYGTALFLLGALAFLPAVHSFPPLDIDLMLIFLGALFFAVMLTALWLDRKARHAATHQLLKRAFYGLLPVPWLIAGLIFVNGRFDYSPPTRHVSQVVGTFAMPGTLRQSRLVVRSWRAGRSVERVAISREEFARFRTGDGVDILVQEGLAGIPWVSAVYHQ